MTPDLFTPIQIGAFRLRNRIVMAPLTRTAPPTATCRALNALYYAQRASAGLIVSEATQVVPRVRATSRRRACTATRRSPAGGASPTRSTRPAA